MKPLALVLALALTGVAHAAPDAAIPDVLGRRFAPELRFNAFVDDDASDQNRNEDFLPGSVDAFFRSLRTGSYPIVTRRSEGARPAEVSVLEIESEPYVDSRHLGGFPERIAGSPPGGAPVYVHVYEAPEEKGVVYYCEYWLFYPYDWTCSRMLSRFGCKGAHRGDWEHTSFRVEVVLDDAGAIDAAEITDGFYYAHGWSVRVPAAAIERAAGDHPVVYVSAGKHGSFPEAGELHDWATTSLLSDHDDFFRGNGVRVALWEASQVDIAPAAVRAKPAPFLPLGWTRLLAGASGSPLGERGRGAPPPTWLEFRGRWGPDLEGVGGLYWTSSPTGPYAKGSFGSRGRGAIPYADWKARYGERLEVYKERGVVCPPLEPAPAPIYRD